MRNEENYRQYKLPCSTKKYHNSLCANELPPTIFLYIVRLADTCGVFVSAGSYITIYSILHGCKRQRYFSEALDAWLETARRFYNLAQSAMENNLRHCAILTGHKALF